MWEKNSANRTANTFRDIVNMFISLDNGNFGDTLLKCGYFPFPYSSLRLSVIPFTLANSRCSKRSHHMTRNILRDFFPC